MASEILFIESKPTAHHQNDFIIPPGIASIPTNFSLIYSGYSSILWRNALTVRVSPAGIIWPPPNHPVFNGRNSTNTSFVLSLVISDAIYLYLDKSHSLDPSLNKIKGTSFDLSLITKFK